MSSVKLDNVWHMKMKHTGSYCKLVFRLLFAIVSLSSFGVLINGISLYCAEIEKWNLVMNNDYF